jgi:hypothetical protein
MTMNRAEGIVENVEGVKAWCTLIVPVGGSPRASVVEVLQIGEVSASELEDRCGRDRIDAIGRFAALQAERALFQHRGTPMGPEMDVLTAEIARERYATLDVRIAGSSEPRLCVRPDDPGDATYVLAAGVESDWVLLGEMQGRDVRRPRGLQ